MTGSIWIGILCVLALGSGLSYSAMKKMSAPLPEYKTPEPQVVQTAPAQATASALAPAQSTAPAIQRDWDSLWKKSLFKDDRTEEEAAPQEASNAPQTPQNLEFELVGLARLGRKDAQVPVAIIVQAMSNQRNRMMRRPGMPNMPMPPGGNNQNFPGRGGPMGGPMRFQPGMPPGMPRFPQPEQNNEKGESEPADKSLYREGDTIAKTDYTVKAIIMEESKVILAQRNGKETVLVLDEKNTNNSVRRETVKREELEQREKVKQAEARAAQEAFRTAQQQQQNGGRFRQNMPMGRNMPNGMFQPGRFGGMPGGQPGGMPQPPNFGGAGGWRPGGGGWQPGGNNGMQGRFGNMGNNNPGR